MKIAPIGFFKSYQNKNVLKPNLYKNNKDFTSFTSKKVQPLKEFVDLIEDEKLRNKVVQEIIQTPKGRYRLEVEKMYLDEYSKILSALESSGNNLSPQDKKSLQEVIYVVFKALKDGDNFIKQDDIDLLILNCYSVLDNIKIHEIQDVLRLSQAQDDENNYGKINTNVASLVLMVKSNLPYLSADEAFKVLQYFIVDDEFIDISLSYAVFKLLQLGDCQSYEDAEQVLSMVLSPEGKPEGDRMKYAGCALTFLQDNVNDEMPKSILNQFYPQIKGMIYFIINQIEQYYDSTHEKFNLNDVVKTFNDWFSYANTQKDSLDKTIMLDTFIQDEEGAVKKSIQEIGELEFGAMPLLDTTVFRLYRILGEDAKED